MLKVGPVCGADDGTHCLRAAAAASSRSVSDLFRHHREQTLRRLAPLADRLRPTRLEDFVGQEAILGPGRLLRRAIAADRVGNLILYGPPGTGKTTLARIIAHSTRAHFSSLNAVLVGVKELRAEVDAAQRRLEQHGLRSILFLDEVHRFNAAQQDALLPWVENGTLTLIGATTENPFFEVNKALVSRARLFRLQPLQPSDLAQLLQRALTDAEHGYGQLRVELSPEARDHLLAVAGGDARSLLNALELAVETSEPGDDGILRIDLAIAEDSIQQRAVLYDKQGDAHFDTISAYIKSIRGSDPDAALFWLARMVEAGENPRFILRRLLISAAEDIGLADPQAMVVVEACAAAFERIGLPEGLYPLAQATLYLAATEKSNSSLGFFDALRLVRTASRQAVPGHLRDANRDGQAFGDGVGYRYPHAYSEHWVAQQYLPAALQGEVFWQPGPLGWEGRLRPRLLQRRAAQLAAAAESACDPPELLSAGPQDPQLARWLQRQAAAEGERLDRLRQRLWQGANIGRLDRVLLLEAHSLLWALDPLEAAAEGEVVLALRDPQQQQRLEAQLQLLEPLRRPRLLLVDPLRPAGLTDQLEASQRFEWIACRQPFRDDDPATRAEAIADLSALAASNAQARLLFSDPLLGPAGSLLTALAAKTGTGTAASPAPSRSAGPAAGEPPLAPAAPAAGASAAPQKPAAATVEEALLQRALALEKGWLAQRQGVVDAVEALLRQAGWRVTRESWEESLALPLGEGLLQRWFGPQADYRERLALDLPMGAGAAVEALFRRHRGLRLPQPLRHCLLRAERRSEASAIRPAATAEAAPAASPSAKTTGAGTPAPVRSSAEVAAHPLGAGVGTSPTSPVAAGLACHGWSLPPGGCLDGTAGACATARLWLESRAAQEHCAADLCRRAGQEACALEELGGRRLLTTRLRAGSMGEQAHELLSQPGFCSMTGPPCR